MNPKQRNSNIAIAALALILSTTAVHASPTSQSFNPKTGALDVNYAAYLSKHDVVFNHPITNPIYGSTLGNGRVGAMVWNKDGINMQVAGIDASEETAFSAGLVHLYTTPGMDSAYSKFQQRLSLYNGTLTTKYDANRTVTVMGVPNSEVIGIHVSDTRPGVSTINLDLSLWDVSKLGGGDVPDMKTWRTVTTYADSHGIGLSRGQADPNNFGYTLGATVQGAKFTTQSVDPNTVRLVITPSSSYTIWIACASRLNAPNHDSITQASTLLDHVEARGYDTTLANYQGWWHAFWQKSFVQYSDTAKDADYMENLYYLYTYIIAAGAYANYPFHFINGDFSAIGDTNSTKWSVAYWYWNQRDVYNSFLASNHPEILDVYNNLYSRNTDALVAHTKEKYGIDGMWVPETMGWDGNARHTDGSDFTKDILSTGTEAAENMYAEYKYTNNAAYLKNTAYPFMKLVAQFYTNKLARNPDTGKYYIAMSNAHETYWGVQNAITDLAAIRSLFPITIKSSQDLGVDSDMRTQWQNVLDNLVAYPVVADGSRYAPHDPPDAENRNGENITSELLWPYSVTGIGAPDYQMALNGWKTRPHPYGNVWSNDAIQAARLGLGDSVLDGMKTMNERYQSYPNGLTNNTNGDFEYIGLHLTVINEALLQSYNDKIRVFPALPDDPSFVSRFTLAASGGFLVSSEYEDKTVKYIGLKSLYGNPATVENPWGNEQLRVRNAADNTVLLTTADPEFTIKTTAGAVYVIERTTRPLSSFTHTWLTGTPNNDAKMLPDSSATLGSFLNGPPDTGKYEAENALLNIASVSQDPVASNSSEVSGMSPGASITFAKVRAGTRLDIRYCTQNNPGKLSLYVNGVLNQDVILPSTNSWNGVYAIKSVAVQIPQGAAIKLQVNPGDSGANIDYIQTSNRPLPSTLPEGPYGGKPRAIPGIIQAEDFDTGGEGIAYHDSDSGNNGGQYRTDEGVDIESTSDTDGGFDVGFTSAGEWMKYTVNVAQAGDYTVGFRMASGADKGTVAGTIHLQTPSGTNLTGPVPIPGTGGWQDWTTVTAKITLPAGIQTLELFEDTGGYNIDYIQFTR